MKNYFDFERENPPRLHEWELRDRLERRNRRRSAVCFLAALLLWQLVYLAAVAWVYFTVNPAIGVLLLTLMTANLAAGGLGAFVIIWKRREFVNV